MRCVVLKKIHHLLYQLYYMKILFFVMVFICMSCQYEVLCVQYNVFPIISSTYQF